jgi:hypothetical protein
VGAWAARDADGAGAPVGASVFALAAVFWPVALAGAALAAGFGAAAGLVTLSKAGAALFAGVLLTSVSSPQAWDNSVIPLDTRRLWCICHAGANFKARGL